MTEVPHLSSACNRAGKTCKATAEELSLSLAEFLLSAFCARTAEGHNYFCHIWAACVALTRGEVSLFHNNFASQSHSTFFKRKRYRNTWIPKVIVVQMQNLLITVYFNRFCQHFFFFSQLYITYRLISNSTADNYSRQTDMSYQNAVLIIWTMAAGKYSSMCSSADTILTV